MNGADASTTFTDSELTPTKSVTAVGNAQIDTAQSKFGGACGLLDGSGDYLTVGDHADWDFGTGDFTIDMWVRFNALGSDRAIIDVNNGETVGVWLKWTTSNVLRVKVASTTRDFTWSPSTNTWYHVAVTRSGTNLRAFVGGTQIGTTLTDSGDITGGTVGVTIGAQNGGSNALNGWLDEVRISKGIARWTANFTPPTSEYRTNMLPVVFFEEYNPG